MRNLFEMYREGQSAVHYSDLAERLGVSRFTAYDMLRLLEEKGLVASRYEVDEERSGPGRSIVVYEPTAATHELMGRLLGDEVDWHSVRERVATLVSEGLFEPEELTRELLARTPVDEEEDVAYCIEVMTVIGLRLPPAARQQLLAELPYLLQKDNCRLSLSLLGGFALGLTRATQNDEAGGPPQDVAWQRELHDHVRTYQRVVLALKPSRCARLAQHLEEVFAEIAAV